MAEPTDASNGPIHLAGATLDQYRHVCAFFHAPDDEYRVLLPFIVEGFRAGAKAFHAVDPKQRSIHLERLHQAGIDVRHAQETGQLEVRSWEEVQLPDGRFDQQKMLAFMREVLESAKSRGFSHTRFITHVASVLEDRPGVNDFLEFEVGLNRMLLGYRDPVI